MLNDKISSNIEEEEKKLDSNKLIEYGIDLFSSNQYGLTLNILEKIFKFKFDNSSMPYTVYFNLHHRHI